MTRPRSFQVFLGGFAPGVYAYILPESAKSANVLELLSVAEQLRAGVLVREKSGWAPIRYFTAKWVYGNLVLVGDVANQNFKPFVEGIIPMIIWVVLRSEVVLAQALPFTSIISARQFKEYKCADHTATELRIQKWNHDSIKRQAANSVEHLVSWLLSSLSI